jgi:hypothetical protein
MVSGNTKNIIDIGVECAEKEIKEHMMVVYLANAG